MRKRKHGSLGRPVVDSFVDLSASARAHKRHGYFDKFGLGLCLVMIGCPPCKPAPKAPSPTASATIWAKSGAQVGGTALFTEEGGKVTVLVTLQNASPGEHGVHIHEFGDCSDPEAKSAGGHYNPIGAPHGGPSAERHHPGDFGNILIGVDGRGELKLEVPADLISVKEGPRSIIGKSVVIDADKDDLTPQTTGNAGGRVGCGTIALVQLPPARP